LDEAFTILQQLDSDPLYLALCRKQKCFRARITPKPWRISMGTPRCGFPLENDEQEIAFHEWLADYNARSAEYGVCEVVEQMGDPALHPEVDFLLGVHDHITCKGAKLA